MKRLILAAVAGGLLLTGCGEPSTQGKTYGDYQYVEVDTPHGSIPCIIWDGNSAGNITCDWN